MVRKLMVAQGLNNILVVDDTPQNLHLLADILTKYDYKVRPVPNGKLALSAAAINPPDLILLDIMMPDLDGYQVCKELKTNPKTKDIPVIFISAINEPVDKVKAFAIGGVDYITKPFQMHEVLMRVKNQLHLKNLKQQLKGKNEQLHQTINYYKQNQKNAVKFHKKKTLNTITAGISQQVNHPLSLINQALEEINQFSESNLKNLPLFLQQITPEQHKYFITLLNQAQTNNINKLLSTEERQELKGKIVAKLENLRLKKPDKVANILIALGFDDEIEVYSALLSDQHYLAILENAYMVTNLDNSIQSITDSANQFTKIITAFENYANVDDNEQKKRPAHLENTIEIALKSAGNKISPGIQIMKNYNDVPSIVCYPEELQKLWSYLIQNAIDAMGKQGILTINLYQDQDKLSVDIIDTGEGIAPEIISKMCDPFFTTKSLGANTGLGLTIAKQIIEQHEGTIAVNKLSGKNSLPGKTKFTVSLPLN